MITTSKPPSINDARLAHVVAMDARRQRVVDSIEQSVMLPDFAALSSALKSGNRERVHAEIRRLMLGHALREKIATVMLNGVCIAMLARKTEALPIVVSAKFRSGDAVPSFATPEASLEYWRVRLRLDEEEVAALRGKLAQFYAATESVAGDITRATLQSVDDFVTSVVANDLSTSEFQRAFVAAVEVKARANVGAVLQTEMARSYGERRFEQALEGGMSAGQTTPFLQFLSVPDDRRTPVCRALHRYIAATDSPIWNLLQPPLHWRCRSDISLIGYREAVRRGIAALTPDGRGLYLPLGPMPYGPPPQFAVDARGRTVPVMPQEGFGLAA